MCYSNSSTSSTSQLAERYKKMVPSPPFENQYFFASGFHFPTWNIITNDQMIQQMRWGLLPQWYGGHNWMDFAAKTLNARLETLTEKASFKHLVHRNRCLVPSSGFFEWQTNGKQKTPYFIKDAGQAVFSIAGIHDTWLDTSTGAIEKTFAILTTEANALMAEIHNTKKRMPLVLSLNEEENWLKGKLSLNQIADRACIQLEAWEIDKKLLLSQGANVAEVQQKFNSPIGKQTGLFD